MNVPEFASEPTAAGEQTLIPGVTSTRLAERLAFLAAAPLLPRKPQRAPDFGLFDLAARNQLELFGPETRARQADEPP